jgi:hypothetical protein
MDNEYKAESPASVIAGPIEGAAPEPAKIEDDAPDDVSK